MSGPGRRLQRVSVPGDERERAALTTSRDEDRRTRSLQGLRHVEETLGDDVMARVGRVLAVFAFPHPHAHLERVFEEIETGADVGEREPEPFAFLLVVARADAEPGAATRQHVERGHRLGEQARRAEVRTGHDGEQPDRLRARGEEREGRVGLEAGGFRTAHDRV